MMRVIGARPCALPGATKPEALDMPPLALEMRSVNTRFGVQRVLPTLEGQCHELR